MKYAVTHAEQTQVYAGYQGLHDYLEAELDSLLRAEDNGFVTFDTEEYEDCIAGLTFALQSINKVVDQHEPSQGTGVSHVLFASKTKN